MNQLQYLLIEKFFKYQDDDFLKDGCQNSKNTCMCDSESLTTCLASTRANVSTEITTFAVFTSAATILETEYRSKTKYLSSSTSRKLQNAFIKSYFTPNLPN